MLLVWLNNALASSCAILAEGLQNVGRVAADAIER